MQDLPSMMHVVSSIFTQLSQLVIHKMKFHIHIPKLEEFALYAACDDITLHGTAGLNRQMPHILYLRCILAFAEKYDEFVSVMNAYCDRSQDLTRLSCSAAVSLLDHASIDSTTELDDLETIITISVSVNTSMDIEHVIACLHRFASRCMAAGKTDMMVNLMSQALHFPLFSSKAIRQVLLQYDAKLDHHDEDYIAHACTCGMHDVIKQVVDSGYVLRSTDVGAAIGSGDIDTVKLMPKRLYSDHLQAHNFDIPFCEVLLSQGIVRLGHRRVLVGVRSVQIVKWFHEHDMLEPSTTLYFAVENAALYGGEHMDIVRYLVEKLRTNVSEDILIKLKLHLTKDLGVIDYLLHHGADVNAINENHLSTYPGDCPAFKAPMLLRFWLDHGAVVGLPTPELTLRLLNTICSKPIHADVLKMMMDVYHIDVNASDQFQMTPLHYACEQGCNGDIEMLIEMGANVNAENDAHETPMALAKHRGFDEIVQILVQHGGTMGEPHYDELLGGMGDVEFGNFMRQLESSVQYDVDDDLDDDDA